MKKKNDDNKKISNKLFSSWFIAGLLLVLSIVFNRWLVFEGFIIITIGIIFTINSLRLINFIVRHYWRTYWILTILPLGLILLFSCSILIVLLMLPPIKKCHIKSINMAECVEDPEFFGNGVPESPPCYWKQMHIAGLFLVGDEIEKECYGYY